MARKASFGPISREPRNYSFSAQIDAIVITTEKRMLALTRQGISETIDDAQTAVAKGGRMRVVTGFLRASGQGSYNGMPSGPVRGEKTEPNSYNYDPQTAEVQLGELKLGSVYHFGWTAEYAKYREAYDGFLENAVRQWPERIARITEEIKARVK